MIKKIVLPLLMLASTYASAASTTLFTGSLYMLDQFGTPVENTQCTSCNALAGEIDNNLATWVDVPGGVAGDIIGNNDLFNVGMDWSMTNLSYVVNPDTTISISGDFLWTNSNGLTISTFTQLSQLGANGELIALDGDNDLVKGIQLIDGPFQGMNLYLEGTISAVPVPAAVWLFGSGLLGLAAVAKRRKA